MRVLICGSRGWHDPDPIHALLAELMGTCIKLGEELIVIHGDAPGADRLAGEIAKQYTSEDNIIAEPADWIRLGRAAGPIRNQKMIDDHKPDRVYAFRSTGKSNGTDDMVKRSEAADLPVVITEGPPTEE